MSSYASGEQDNKHGGRLDSPRDRFCVSKGFIASDLYTLRTVGLNKSNFGTAASSEAKPNGFAAKIKQ